MRSMMPLDLNSWKNALSFADVRPATSKSRLDMVCEPNISFMPSDRVWQGDKHGEAEKLTSCYRRSMEIASELEVCSIAFPAISCGAYRYPLDQAAEIAISTIGAMLERSTVKSVIFAIVDPYVADAYQAVFDRTLNT